ncbi:hypothetical protein PITC_074930 [Penicillium italicum]|uniref:Uncharacterized protein n=1 Tax=Penicillium italicum TaxID=40296 RepID=A0A0A2LC62_PENIT|nr:hypothetical protein PITC_074930 [Penicillium italicum]
MGLSSRGCDPKSIISKLHINFSENSESGSPPAWFNET